MDKITNAGKGLYNTVFHELEAAILREDLKPGDPLVEQHLCAKFGVSRTPLREALRQLEQEGLVRTLPNRSTVVVGVSAQDINDIYTIRMSLEGLCARLAAERITDEQLARMRENVELQHFYLQKKDTSHIWTLDSEFHALLFEACHSRMLERTLTLYHNYVQQARMRSFKTDERSGLATEEHVRILQALEAHDGDGAERATVEHIRKAKENVDRVLGKS